MSSGEAKGRPGAAGDEDEAIASYQALRPRAFTHLERFALVQPATPGADVALHVTLRRPLSSDPMMPVLALSFYGVDQLRFTPSRFLPVYLDISSIRDRGWERLRYVVHEEEEDRLRFFCVRFEARLADSEDAPRLDPSDTP